MQIGDTIEFGKYKWRVLDIKNSAAIITVLFIVALGVLSNYVI